MGGYTDHGPVDPGRVMPEVRDTATTPNTR